MEVKEKIPQEHLTESFVNHLADMLSSYLWIGDVQKMRFYMNMLKEILDVEKKLWLTIPEKDKQRIIIIGKALKEDKIPNPWGDVKLFDFEQEDKQKEFKIKYWEDEEDEIEKIEKEKELNNIINATYDCIKYITGDSSKLIISREVNMKYGRADIKAQGDKNCHAIELKLGEANHKIVGQIMKYMRSIGSKLHLGLYEEVKGVTVAKEYTENSLLDLQMMGIRTFTYSLSNGSISLNRI